MQACEARSISRSVRCADSSCSNAAASQHRGLGCTAAATINNYMFYKYFYKLLRLDAVPNLDKSMNFLHIVRHIKQKPVYSKKYLTSNRLSVEFKLLQCNIFSFRGDCTRASWNRPET